ncbi:NADH:ubiquinone reductase (Na(+)-transporting) subunit B [Xanthovirga aplysinae]|uniref:NADH:ubiquinone reductase (Na(+)-transporting) subunit B n=1 Tax=Xanthovirga aplysinae TaxID=2529853 RepID=UPI0012BB52CB|nr:NADH:ubiquinone reductase (Na(+)-transporting) subunit B [Xanthovirga aplysinae]MTI30304.1 NADH:ubiquinone reductase (Na(+)-transporting) subunit B [Xanthovirga aplysinae]
MKALRDQLDKIKPLFSKGGKFEKFHYAYDAADTFLFSPNTVTSAKGTQIKDAIDLKRMMVTVVVAMIPALLYGMWNVGQQHFMAIGETASFMEKFGLGAIVVLPIVIVAYTAGGIVEAIFAIVRKHPINEGFLVTGMLIPLVVPPTLPLWQVALATIFGVLIGKEVFGGTGMNILNVALVARAFLYFGYPTDISGDQVWVYLGGQNPVEGFSGATALAVAASAQEPVTQALTQASQAWYAGMFDFTNMFMGAIPGSIGETSTLMCLIGALILIFTGVGSWKTIVGVFVGSYLTALLMNLIGANEFMLMPAEYHLVIGGLAFGAVFMATDPVSSAHTETGKWIYGILIGVVTVIIRVLNPAYPEGIMLAILLMNVFAPLIDYNVVQANKKRRLKRATV